MAVGTSVAAGTEQQHQPEGTGAPSGRAERQPARRRLAAWFRPAVAAALAATAFLSIQGAFAIGLGPAGVGSSLGEPLRLSVPVSLAPDEEIGCVQVRSGGGDLPGVFNTRVQVIRAGAATRIEIRSAQPVNEPAIGLVLSVGCSSPIARDYVLFLDPPVIAPTIEAGATTTPLQRVNPMPTPVRRVPRVASPSRASVDQADAVRPPPRAARPARPQTRAPAVVKAPQPEANPAQAQRSTPPAGAVAPPVGASGSDRLSVVPTEPPRGIASSAAPGAATPGVPATAPAPVVTDTVAASAAIAAAAADAAEREDGLRQQQVALQSQLKSLGDQIAVLRAQATTLSERNQALERAATSPWWLIALAALAILLAAWMSWRYLQLRRSIEGSAWWTNQTVQAPSMLDPAEENANGFDDSLNPVTRIAPRPVARTDVRGTAARATATRGMAISSQVGAERAKPVVRPTTYPAAIDTDFTVSDIEAAMATVRTVSPPRPPASTTSLSDSDFAPLGGETLPSPFADPPPGAPGSVPPKTATSAASAAPATPAVPALPVVPLVAAASGSAQFVDFDIPPIQPLVAVTKPGSVPSAPSAKVAEFLLDPADQFDPLASDSMKTTVFDRASHSLVDGSNAHTPTSLDFELPTPAQVLALTNIEGTPPAAPTRHTGTLLDDLFETTNALGPDTILAMDERHGDPLSTTEVDRLIATDAGLAADAASADGSAADRPPRTRMAKFAELMNRVDEVAATEPLRAIAQLRQFVLRDEHIPTLLWLRLFELYRQVDKKPVYNALAEHFARRYHRPMIAWGESLADRVPQTPLSAHPEIDREIASMWGFEKGRARLESLLCDRDQDDSIVFNAVLQHDLLDAAKIFPAIAAEDGAPSGGKAA